MEELAEGMKAMADPIRLRRLNLLRHGELRVRDLTACLELSRSKSLTVLMQWKSRMGRHADFCLDRCLKS